MNVKYPKIINLGDPLLKDLFNGEVYIEEKVDGSQFRVWFDENGVMFSGSKGVDYSDERQPDKMFLQAIENAKKHFEDIKPLGFFFVFEYIKTKCHNTLNYDRTPKDFLVVLDIFDGKNNRWLRYGEKKLTAEQYGFECIPLLKQGVIETQKDFEDLLKTTSFLGGQTVEGVVIKNYSQFHTLPYMLGMPVFGKWVREEFRELNKQNWDKEKESIEDKILRNFQTTPIYEKAFIHLKEKGELVYQLKDMAKLFPEVETDFLTEAETVVKEMLWNDMKKTLSKRITKDLVVWYKNKLLEVQFKDGEKK
jgi:hypothetical protein